MMVKSGSIRHKRMLKFYDGHKGSQTVDHVLQLVGDDLQEDGMLTGRQLGLAMSAVNRAYQAGKASAGAEMMDTNLVWINSLQRAIEWNEVGAEGEWITKEETLVNGNNHNVTKWVKTKDGELVPQFTQ